MPFTAAEKTRIRMLLGWGARFWQTETRLESAMAAVETDFPDEMNLIKATLVTLTDIDAKITDALETVGVSAVSTIHLDSDQGLSHLRAEGRRLVSSIATTLQVPINRNFYGGGLGGWQT